MDSGERLERLRALLGLEAGERDDELADALLDMEAGVLAYLNLDTLPAGLEGALVLMTAQAWRQQPPGSASAAGAVSAVTRGDLSVSFGGSGSDAAQPGAGVIPAGWTGLLDCYRRPRR